jgi:hypothetical protein
MLLLAMQLLLNATAGLLLLLRLQNVAFAQVASDTPAH